MQRLILTLLLSLLLAACASTRMPTPLVQLPTLQLAPSALPQPVQLQQRLQFRFGSHQRELDALLEAKPDFVVSCQTKAAMPGMTMELLRRGVPVLSETPLSSFIACTASTASPVTSRVFSQPSGSVSVEEKTTFDIELSSSTPSSPLAAKPDINR